MDSKVIRNALQARGIELGPPVSGDYLAQFEKEMALSLDEYFRRSYCEFNGFESCDKKSQICLWPLGRILQNRSLSIQVENELYFLIGDFLIDSDFLVCCLQRERAPIFLLYERRELALAASAFFEKLISGDFDYFAR